MEAFESILSPPGAGLEPAPEAPACFDDLHLDQVVAALSDGREEFDLTPFLHTPLHDVETVSWRHHVVRDLDDAHVLGAIRDCCEGLALMRRRLALADKLRHRIQRQRWFLAGAEAWCAALASFDDRLTGLELRSPALIALRDHVAAYRGSERFRSLVAETADVVAGLDAIRYAVQISGNRVRVDAFQGEPDVSEEVRETFERFRRRGGKDRAVAFRDHLEINHVEGQILDLASRLEPEPFAALRSFCERHREFADLAIVRFDREVQFYLAYLEHIEPLKARGLQFSLPRVSARSKEEHASQTFDLALASKLADSGATVVVNDFQLSEPERILVVSGPNNGGKTTFARTFGQLHHLAALGLPVPGSDVRLLLPDRIHAHFEREEDLRTLRGKFEDELYRIHEILQTATGDSVLIMNESFSSTTLRDALLVGAEVVREISQLGALCVFVTFVDELASLNERTVSMMSTVDPENPAQRTFRLVRKPADGLAYAAAVARKHGLTYETLRARIER
ncbi:MAG: MutS-related protein [Solirubrobacteraceae bacterium]